MDTRAAIRYARALFGAAKRQNCIYEVEADLKALADLTSAPGPIHDFVFEPRIPRNQKLERLVFAFKGKQSPLTPTFLKLLLKKQREADLPAIYIYFEDFRREHEAVLHVTIHSSESLDDRQRESLLAKLSKQTGKKLEPEFEIDPDLLGGVKVSFENFVLDGSVRGSLDRLRSKMLLDVLKQA